MMIKKSILIVEDDHDLREIFAEMFVDEGFEVFESHNGQEALDFLLRQGPENYPSCIVLDIMMPIMSGSLFLATVNKQHFESIGTIPVVICSGHGDYINCQQIVTKLTKPVDLATLCSTVEGAIKGSHQSLFCS